MSLLSIFLRYRYGYILQQFIFEIITRQFENKSNFQEKLQHNFSLFHKIPIQFLQLFKTRIFTIALFLTNTYNVT